MESHAIDASLSTQSLTFRPGGPPAAFEITVVNRSDQFAAFQLEVLAPGASRSSGAFWYRLTPEVAAAKPTGGVTLFQIVIFDTPLPTFVGTINLTVRIFSPQLNKERKLLVRLTIEQGIRPTLLSVELPVQQLQVYPRNTIDIPVRVQNLGQQPADVVLEFVGLDRSWLTGSAERRLLVDPGTQVEATFQCQPPTATQVPSDNYEFTIEASSRDGPQGSAKGSLEVLPVGFIQLTTSPQQQTIPDRGRWLPDWKTDSALFQLLFKNTSNLRQQVDVQLQGKDQKKCTCTVTPKKAEAGLGETTEVLLKVKTKRPWLGLAKTLRLEARALPDQRLDSTDPAIQSLELRVLPIIPLWLLLALLTLLAALLALLLRPPVIAHTDFVNSVRISGNALLVLSGSDDCTIRRWQVDGDKLEPSEVFTEGKVSCGAKPFKPQGVLAVADVPVRTLQVDPINEQRVAAGLENGLIQLWNVPTGKQIDQLDQDGMRGDRVFDLVFSKDSRFLFSGHAGGKVRVWERAAPNKQFQPAAVKAELSLSNKQNYQVRTLALSQDESILVSAGQYKKLFLWDRNNLNSRPRRLSLQELSGGQGQNDYIWSIAFLPGPRKLLTTSDSDGYITIWNLDECQNTNTASQPDEPIEQKCSLHARWLAAEKSVEKAVRSIAFDADGRRLVSAGDDGRIVVWSLTPEGKLDQTAVKGQPIFRSSGKINSIALLEVSQGTMIVSGGDDFQVKLHRLK